MRKTIAVLLVCLCGTSFAKEKGAAFTDLVVFWENVFALTDAGAVRVYDLHAGVWKKSLPPVPKAEIIAADNKGHIYTAGRKKIYRYDDAAHRWLAAGSCKSKILALLFDIENKCYAVTDGGIEDVKTGKMYMPARPHELPWTGMNNVSTSYMDLSGNIWLGFDAGEWGGGVLVFNTVQKVFAPDTAIFSWLPVRSFFAVGQQVYLSAGLDHVMMCYGAIVKFDHFKETIILESATKRINNAEKGGPPQMIPGEYIGPATYDPYEHCIYFYSQHGIFKGDISKDLSILANWVKIADPKLKWQYGMPNAAGDAMNVTKMVVVGKGALIFLSPGNGIGYYNGKELKML